MRGRLRIFLTGVLVATVTTGIPLAFSAASTSAAAAAAPSPVRVFGPLPNPDRPAANPLSTPPTPPARSTGYAAEATPAKPVSAKYAAAEDDWPSVTGQLTQQASVSGTGGISGILSRPGGPANGACVTVYSRFGSLQGSARTNASGAWTVPNLGTDDYKVLFGACSAGAFASEWYADKLDLDSATIVHVTDGAVTTGINATLAAGGTIRGTVSGPSAAAPGVCVQADLLSDDPVSFRGSVTTSSTGAYSLGLSPGRYRLLYTPCTGSTQLLSEYFNDRRSQFEADLVTVTQGGTFTANATLATGSTITGAVRGPTGAAVAGVCVSAFPRSGGFSASATTTSTGAYTLTGLRADKYRLRFEPACMGGNFVAEYYNDHHDFSAADLVTVPASSAVPNIDVVLEAGGTMTGTVRNAAGTALPGICVDVRGHDFTTHTGQTNASGVYSVNRLRTDSYTAFFRMCNPAAGTYIPEFYDNARTQATATKVDVTAGVTVPSIGATLEPGASITGDIRDATGALLPSICVSAFSPTFSAGVATNASGRYQLLGLPPGDYAIQLSPCGTSANVVTGFLGGTGSDFYDAQPVTVTAGAALVGVDGVMRTGGQLVGKITNPSGVPEPNVCVFANGDVDQTDANGGYRITQIPTGNYSLFISPCAGQQLESKAISSRMVLEGIGTLVNTQLTAAPPPPQVGSITGKVTGPTGANLAGVCASASGPSFNTTLTAANGTYSITGLLPGTYTVEFDPCNAGNVLPETYDNQPDNSTATPVPVVANQPTANINAQLAAGARITGTVTGPTGAAEPGVCVQASPVSAGASFASARTRTNGTYILDRLQAGDYKVVFTPCLNQTDVMLEWFNNKPDFSTADLVSVGAGATRSAIHAKLDRAGSITGTVTGPAGAEQGVCVSIASGPRFASTTTASDGTYTLTGLTTGSYQVLFRPTCADDRTELIDEYFNNKATLGTANPVSVTTGSATPNINALLDRGGSISGRVTSATNLPLTGVSVFATSLTDFNSRWTATRTNGTYTIKGLRSSNYRVQFSPSPEVGQFEYYDNTQDPSAATPVPVSQPAGVTGINAVLEPPTTSTATGSISGRVTDLSGRGLGGVCVRASGPSFGSTVTPPGGRYVLTGLAPGNFTVDFTQCSNRGAFPRQYYNATTDPTEADPVNVTAGAVTPDIDAAVGPRQRPNAALLSSALTNRAVWRPSNGAWYRQSAGGTAPVWGLSTDIPVAADFNGDGIDDLAVYRPSTATWFVKDGPALKWGQSGDMPVPADYDGDGDDDLALYRPSTGHWYVLGQAVVAWGKSGDIPVPGDYDGDGRFEPAVWRPSNGNWLVKDRSPIVWGLSTDRPVQADYDGDGVTDLMVWRPSTGFWYRFGCSCPAVQWGKSTDKPVPGDYDGDGLTEIAVWRPSTGVWYVSDTPSIPAIAWGIGTGSSPDVPVVMFPAQR